MPSPGTTTTVDDHGGDTPRDQRTEPGDDRDDRSATSTSTPSGTRTTEAGDDHGGDTPRDQRTEPGDDRDSGSGGSGRAPVRRFRSSAARAAPGSGDSGSDDHSGSGRLRLGRPAAPAAAPAPTTAARTTTAVTEATTEWTRAPPVPVASTQPLRVEAAEAARWVTVSRRQRGASQPTSPVSPRRVLTQVAAGLAVVLLVVGLLGSWAAQRLAEREAVTDAATIADVLAEARDHPGPDERPRGR